MGLLMWISFIEHDFIIMFDKSQGRFIEKIRGEVFGEDVLSTLYKRVDEIKILG